MKKELKDAIQGLGTRLREWPWTLYNSTIRCSVMEKGEDTAELRLCPIGVAASQASTGLIERVLGNTPNEDFRNEVRGENRSGRQEGTEPAR